MPDFILYSPFRCCFFFFSPNSQATFLPPVNESQIWVKHLSVQYMQIHMGWEESSYGCICRTASELFIMIEAHHQRLFIQG